MSILLSKCIPDQWSEGDIQVFANSMSSSSSWEVQAQDPRQAGETMLDIIEVKPMENKELVDASALADSVTRTGHAAVYGIYFDTGKDVKPESDAALKEIAKLLQRDPKLKRYVVGHTDNKELLRRIWIFPCVVETR
jgi:outer membrane protein OmpA-like peptidoglycan-associated protein